MESRAKPGNLIGSFAFLIGVILAVIVGVLPIEQTRWTALTLVIIGVIVGLLNISGQEAMGFLAAGTVLVLVSHFGADVFQTIGPWAINVLDGLKLVFVPATIIVALKSVFTLARD